MKGDARMGLVETWRDIPGYGGMYQISFDGYVRSWRGGRWGKRKKPKIMKIKIKNAELPVAAEVRPEVGSVHEVVDQMPVDAGVMYLIRVGGTGGIDGAQIGVMAGDCEVVEA